MEPYIISASRREDIPAFKAEWLMQRLKEGFVTLNNGYSDYQVSFAKAKLFVFWTKNPKPLIKYLKDFPFPFYFQFTLNDYPEYELKVPSLNERIDTFIELSETYGKERVIWRFDPIISFPTKDDEGDRVLSRIAEIGNQIHSYTEKLVFSFIDPYRKLNNTFKEVPLEQQLFIIDQLKEMNWMWGLKLATCAEGIDVSGVEHNKCIDPELVKRICGDEEWINPKKDFNQRLLCGCMVSGDIGMFKQCKHQCLYCYAK